MNFFHSHPVSEVSRTPSSHPTLCILYCGDAFSFISIFFWKFLLLKAFKQRSLSWRNTTSGDARGRQPMEKINPFFFNNKTYYKSNRMLYFILLSVVYYFFRLPSSMYNENANSGGGDGGVGGGAASGGHDDGEKFITVFLVATSLIGVEGEEASSISRNHETWKRKGNGFSEHSQRRGGWVAAPCYTANQKNYSIFNLWTTMSCSKCI